MNIQIMEDIMDSRERDSLDGELEQFKKTAENKPHLFNDNRITTGSGMTRRQCFYFKLRYLINRFEKYEQYEKCTEVKSIIDKFYKNYTDEPLERCITDHIGVYRGLGYLKYQDYV